ncbi:MAG: 5-formyltetrahydrofolate cyclo-ligase [Gammaproteobacteria bacterium]|nr:5-formyltetrahydrofolate cyclo-ligase [Gammaproteobacteria bacterium]
MTGPQSRAREKRELRATLGARRQGFSASERMQAAEAVSNQLLSHPLFNVAGYVAGYWAMGGEVPLHVLQMRLRADQVWCLPCIQPDKTLRFAPWRPGDLLESNRFGIPEPALTPDAQLLPTDMAVILMPLLAFTRAGARLGMGGGFYDRSLAFPRLPGAQPRLIGVGYAAQEVPDLPSDPWDVALDAVVTDKELLICRPAG